MRYTQKSFTLLLFFALLLLAASACSQQFWFRNKVKVNRDTDSGNVEKDFQIVW